MKAYWITLGVGALVAVVGGVIWTTTDHKLGFMLILAGLVIAVLGAVMAIVQWAMNKGKSSAAS